MNITEPVSIRELLAVAASSEGATVGVPGQPGIPLSLGRAAELYAAFLDDHRAYGLGLLRHEQVDGCRITFTYEDGVLVAAVRPSGLRYQIDPDPGGEPTARLCLAPGCRDERLGRRLFTVYCDAHLCTVIPGLLPNAGDDILPGDRERAAAESRTRRLAVYAEETAERQRAAEGEHRVALHLQGIDQKRPA